MTTEYEPIEKDPIIAATEADAVKAAPAPVQPEVKAIEDQFNAAVDTSAAKAPEAEKQAAQVDPATEAVAQDATNVLKGGTIDYAQLSHDVPAFVKEVKAGYKTTEFWLSAAVIALTNIGVFHFPDKFKAIATAASAAAYALSRGLAK